jgi:PAS domain-containing protein
MTQPIELILMRELAGHLATPIFVIDPAGDLLFYNEPAELLLGTRFDETGMLPFAEWSTMFKPTNGRGAYR